ncbi:DUF6588 family protein, partial [Arthrospira platensis SPKY1]|nr:DUF6588 family protein [Arthrospira platensis SPKY1]
DYSLLQLRDETGPVHVPSALGGKQLTYLTASVGGNEFDIRVPEGVNMESIVYPYLQGSVGLWGGTEFIGRYSTRVRLKREIVSSVWSWFTTQFVTVFLIF